MIRINLIATHRPRARRPLALQIGQKLTVVCSLIVVATALGIGWQYWSLRQQSEALDAEIAVARRETERLRSIIEQVNEFEARRAQLMQRVALIEQLRQGQSEPVRLLDQISMHLPDRLWLTQLVQDGHDVTIQGRTTTLVALSDLVGQLEGSGYFRPPVEILDSQVEASSDGDVIRFSVKAQFTVPGS